MSITSIPRLALLASILAPAALALAATPFVNGSDSCATPDAIAGAGPFAFDNGLATTGTEGQATTNCLFYGQNGIAQDVWFAWTAAQSGRVLLTTCGQTSIDTKIAADRPKDHLVLPELYALREALDPNEE